MPWYSKRQKLKRGDIVNIDVTVIKDGYFGDNSKMYVVEKPIFVAKSGGSGTRSFMWDYVRLSRVFV